MHTIIRINTLRSSNFINAFSWIFFYDNLLDFFSLLDFSFWSAFDFSEISLDSPSHRQNDYKLEKLVTQYDCRSQSGRKLGVTNPRSGPRFWNFCWPWSGPVPGFETFLGPCPNWSRDFLNFPGPGPSWSRISKSFSVPVRAGPWILAWSLKLNIHVRYPEWEILARNSPILGLALLRKELLIPRFQPAKSLFDIFFDIEQPNSDIKNIIFVKILIRSSTSSLKILSDHKFYKASRFFFYITRQYADQDWYFIDVTNDMRQNPNGLKNGSRNKFCQPQIITVLF